MIIRPSRHEYYLNIASDVAKRSTCLRSIYGTVIVKDDTIKSTGVNGSCRGAINCCDLGYCRREKATTRTGYDACPAIHSEENAVLFANNADTNGASLYIVSFGITTGEYIEKLGEKALPCWRCFRILTNAKISQVIVRGENQPLIYSMDDLKKVDPVSFGKD